MLYLLHAFLLSHLVPASGQIREPHPREDELQQTNKRHVSFLYVYPEQTETLLARSDRVQDGWDAYLERLVHDLGPLLGPLRQLGALHGQEVVLLLLAGQRDVDPGELEPLHAHQLLPAVGEHQRQRVVAVVVVVLGFHIMMQRSVRVLVVAVRLVRRRPLLRRSLLRDGPDGTTKGIKHAVNQGIVVVVVVGKGKKGWVGCTGGGTTPTRRLTTTRWMDTIYAKLISKATASATADGRNKRKRWAHIFITICPTGSTTPFSLLLPPSSYLGVAIHIVIVLTPSIH